MSERQVPGWQSYSKQTPDYINDTLRGEIAILTAQRDKLLDACEQAASYMPCGEPSFGNGRIEPEGWAEVIENLRAAIAAVEGIDTNAQTQTTSKLR